MVRTTEDVEFEIKTLHAQIKELEKKIADKSKLYHAVETEIEELVNKRCAAMGKLAGLGLESTISKIMAGDAA